MKFGKFGICLITDDVERLAGFYAKILKVEPDGDNIHSDIPEAGISIYLKSAAESDMEMDFSKYNGTGRFVMSCQVDDLEGLYEEMEALGVEFVTSLKSYPWGAKSFYFRDPDGNIVGFNSKAE